MSLQKTIFNPKEEEAGYRLHYLQLFNWGTFGEEKVWTIRPEGQTSLLTGANGSGKTTLVDAILTLLVPSRLRFYNQSSGTETKRDRSEASYVLGAYSQSQEEGRLGATTQYLREQDQAYSVILACFFNEGLQRHLTLGQVRWFSPGGKLQQEYFTAPKALDIIEHNIQYQPGKFWKEALRQKFDLTFYKSFAQYQAFFLRAFGMRSEKALNLFNQTVGIKVLGKLDTFIREHMIEPGDPEEEFAKLTNSFQTLLSSYRAFEMARKQLEMLEPVVKANEKQEALTQKRQEAVNLRDGLPFWFSAREQELLEVAYQRNNQELSLVKEKLESYELKLEEMREQASTLQATIDGNETGRQIRELKREIRSGEISLNKSKRQAQKYNSLAEAVELRSQPTKTIFLDNLLQIQQMAEACDKARRKLKEAQIEATISLRGMKEDAQQKEAELQSLRQRKSRIPARNVRLRARILEAVGASEAKIPFVGELLKVKPKETETWENAIEGIMHNFALRLIVPDAYYDAVNRFVNQTHLSGRVVYHRVSPSTYSSYSKEDLPEALFHKLKIQPDTPYYDWVEKELRRRFDHFCTTDLAAFRQYEKVLSPQGLSKAANRHEKDDRPLRRKEENYILGWDNKEKILLLEGQLRELTIFIKNQEKELAHFTKEIRRLEKKETQLELLRQYESFEEINWQAIALQIQENEKQLLELENSSEQLKVLEQQLSALKKDIKELDKGKTEVIEEHYRLTTAVDGHSRKIEELTAFFKSMSAIPPSVEQALEAYFGPLSDKLNLRNISRLREQAHSKLIDRLEKLTLKLQKAQNTLLAAMGDFKNPPPEVQERFRSWLGETTDLQRSTAAVGDYIRIYDRIKVEKLLQYEKRFRKYLDEKMVGDMGNFQTALYNRLELIKESIRELNISLKNIDFRSSPRTYIQLADRPQSRPEIRDFQQKLRSNWKFDTGLYEKTRDMKLLEKSFHKIAEIIRELSEDENRRKRLLDVRNWLVFQATEHHKDTDKQYMVYESTGHLSGGEKAQITYTILGAALAYQFGIDRGGHKDKSFRFIVVDEAFSKLDPEKSRYLMDLCKQLHLQLLVVTPLDKIHVAEPYIEVCHYVENKEKRNSRVYDLTFEEYKEREAGEGGEAGGGTSD